MDAVLDTLRSSFQRKLEVLYQQPKGWSSSAFALFRHA